MNNKFFILNVYVFACLLIWNGSFAQTTITGPACVTDGITYLYTINGKIDSAQTAKVCVTGGKMESINSDCLEGKSLRFIKVAWDSGATTGKLQVSSNTGNAAIVVNITQSLQAGSINAGEAFQGIDSTKIPHPIHCSAPAGGSCNPIYQYQWEQSGDNIYWSKVNGASDQSLVFITPILSTTYYRRKVKVAGSDAVAYTQSAAVFINPIIKQ